MTDVKLKIRKVNTEKYREDEEKYIGMLYPDRQEKVRKLVNSKNRYVSMEAGFLLQETAKTELGIEPEDIKLVRGENGKPALMDYPDFHFNISHSGECVVIAYGNVPVGVDVEQLRDKDYKLAKRCFTEEEFEYISRVEDKSNERFFEIWTMKESYLKLTGQGISVPLNSFCVRPGEAAAYKKDDNGKLCRLPVQFKFEDVEGYVVCVARDKCAENKPAADM